MDIKKQNKLLVWAVIILIITNVATIGGLWFTQSTINKNAALLAEKNTTDKEHKHQNLINELKLNEEQNQQIKALRSKHFKQLHIIKDSIYKDKEKIHQQIFSNNPNLLYINQLSDSIGLLNAEFEKLNNNHFLEVKSYLTSEQQVAFEKLLKDASFGLNFGKHQQRKHKPE